MQEDLISEDEKHAEISRLIKDFIGYLRVRWFVVLFLAFLGGAIGFVYAYFDKPVYSATLSFVLEDDKAGGGGGALGLASQLGLDLGGSTSGGMFTLANIAELMRSRSLVEKALLSPVTQNNKTTSFAELYIEFNEWRKQGGPSNPLNNIHFTPDPDRSKFDVKQDSILGIIYKNLITDNLAVGQHDKRVSIMYLTIKSRDEFFSKNFTEVLAKVVAQFYVETKTKKSTQNMRILQSQVDSIRGELNNAMLGVASSNDVTYNLNPAMAVKKVPAAKKQVDVQTNSALLVELVKNLELAKVSVRRETPLIQVVDRPIFPLDKQKKSKRNGLMVGFVLGGFLSCFLLMFLFFLQRKKNA